jgi:hypothetical protein
MSKQRATTSVHERLWYALTCVDKVIDMLLVTIHSALLSPVYFLGASERIKNIYRFLVLIIWIPVSVVLFLVAALFVLACYVAYITWPLILCGIAILMYLR